MARQGPKKPAMVPCPICGREFRVTEIGTPRRHGSSWAPCPGAGIVVHPPVGPTVEIGAGPETDPRQQALPMLGESEPASAPPSGLATHVLAPPPFTTSSAAFDPSRTYRYALVRRWGTGPIVLWIMLNPSSADERTLDPTLTRCLGFSIQWGFDAFSVCNLYALRSPRPAALWRVADPVGPLNDEAIELAIAEADLIVVGWGVHAKPDRVAWISELLARSGKPVACLRVQQDGSPGHPLYIARDTVLRRWPSGKVDSALQRPWRVRGGA